jgi:hypothetical protein
MTAHDHDETVQVQDNEFVTECQVTVTEDDYEIAGSFHAMIPFGVNHEFECAGNELDRIEHSSVNRSNVFSIGKRLKPPMKITLNCFDWLTTDCENMAGRSSRSSRSAARF